MDLNPIPRLKNFYNDARHIMSVSYKPDLDSFRRTLKIVLIGVLILGILGFIISFVINNIILAAP